MSELVIDAKQWAKHPWNAFGKKVVGAVEFMLLTCFTVLALFSISFCFINSII
jgi:hypothetical protein